jgi:hypothetical protein
MGRRAATGVGRTGGITLLVVTALAASCGGGASPAPPPAPKCAGLAPVTYANEDPAYLPDELRACAFDVSCPDVNDWAAYDRSIGQAPQSCLTDWNLEGLDGTACARNAKTCDEWLACATHGYCASWCSTRGLTVQSQVLWQCDGDEVVVCNEPQGFGVPWTDCAAQGMHCAQIGPNAGCTDGNFCDAESNPVCAGNVLVSCESGLEQSQDCAASGGTCAPFLITSTCLGPQTISCTAATYPEQCVGNVWDICYGGIELPFDCAAPVYGATCVTEPDGSVGCVPNANECDGSTPDTCEGTNFVTCGTDAKLAAIDCTTLGFRTCGDVGGRAGCVQ